MDKNMYLALYRNDYGIVGIGGSIPPISTLQYIPFNQYFVNLKLRVLWSLYGISFTEIFLHPIPTQGPPWDTL